MDVEDLLSGLSHLVNRILTRLDCHHEEQLEHLNKIGNELQFICEELEDKALQSSSRAPTASMIKS